MEGWYVLGWELPVELGGHGPGPCVLVFKHWWLYPLGHQVLVSG